MKATWYSVLYEVVSELPLAVRGHHGPGVGDGHEDVSRTKTRKSFSLLNLSSVFVGVSILND